MSHKTPTRFLAFIAFCVLLVGCGSGSPTANQAVPPENQFEMLAPGSADHAFLGDKTAKTASGTSDLDCRDFVSQAEAQIYFDTHGGSSENNVDALDWNHNGKPCEVNESWTMRSNRWTNPQNPNPNPPVVTPPSNPGMCWVNGYYRKDGTYVKGYWRRC